MDKVGRYRCNGGRDSDDGWNYNAHTTVGSYLPNAWGRVFVIILNMLQIKYVTLSREFRFSAAHRLHREEWSEEKNREAFGKCSSLHGHDYRLKVTVRSAGEGDMVVNVFDLKSVVEKEVISLVDHRNLNTDVPFLAGVLPTMENIARKIAERLEEPLRGIGAELHEITLWESENNSATLHFA